MRRFGKLRTRLLSSLRKRAPRRNTDNSRESNSDDADSNSSQQQLHWSEARRIYSEPATREMKVERSRDSSSSSGNLVGEKKKNKKRNCLRGEAVAVDTDRGSPESDSQCESEGEDDDEDDDGLS